MGTVFYGKQTNNSFLGPGRRSARLYSCAVLSSATASCTHPPLSSTLPTQKHRPLPPAPAAPITPAHVPRQLSQLSKLPASIRDATVQRTTLSESFPGSRVEGHRPTPPSRDPSARRRPITAPPARWASPEAVTCGARASAAALACGWPQRGRRETCSNRRRARAYGRCCFLGFCWRALLTRNQG